MDVREKQSNLGNSTARMGNKNATLVINKIAISLLRFYLYFAGRYLSFKLICAHMLHTRDSCSK